jgi:uncharacterized SAM-binding protein YcdF (DUF218 family)
VSWRLVARVLGAPLAIGTRPIATRAAIVVLGARLGPGDVLTAVLAERVSIAAELFAARAAPRVIATGGVTGHARRAEAEVLGDALVMAGVPREAITVEACAQTTAENARFTAALLPRGAQVWLVTQPFHARRAEYLFRAVGLDARAWFIDGLQDREPRRAVRWIAREYAAWLKLLLWR